MQLFGVEIAGTGSYVPERVLTNHDLANMVETSDEWIRTRTGIRERHIAADDEPTSALACKASEKALEDAQLAPEDIDLIVVATMSPDTPFPNTGCHLQHRLGATEAACFSLEAGCSGFIYALQVAGNMLRAGCYSNALVVGAEKMSMYLDWTDRTTCVLFGDGAGAVVLRQVDAEDDALLATKLGSDGEHVELLHVPGGGSQTPLTHEALDQKLNYLKMSGREVFKLAVNAMVGAAENVLEQTGIPISEVTWLVPHQANNRIISAVGKRLGIPDDRVYINVDKYGNTSAATIPIAIDEIARGNSVARGDYVLLTAFGGGFTWGATLLRW